MAIRLTWLFVANGVLQKLRERSVEVACLAERQCAFMDLVQIAQNMAR